MSGKPLDVEQMAYDLVRFGFVMLTIGLLVGSVWAKSAWGDYWVWDPKENWSLVTWLAFGLYLHQRRFFGWQGEKAAWLLLLCFLLSVLSLFFVPLVDSTLHSEYFQ